MKYFYGYVLFIILSTSCKKATIKEDTPEPEINYSILTDNTIVVSSDSCASSLVAVDSNSITFISSGIGVNKIIVGSILVSDMTAIAPNGFLRKVVSITESNDNKICITEQAALTDAIFEGKCIYSKTFSESDIINADTSGIDISNQKTTLDGSFLFPINAIVDKVIIKGSLKIEPSMDFELMIDKQELKKFKFAFTVKKTCAIRGEVKIKGGTLSKSYVLTTLSLKPFTIWVGYVPIAIARQWIVIEVGVDGKISAKITTSAQRITTLTSGILYENGDWSTIHDNSDIFHYNEPTFSAEAHVDPWVSARYEIRAFGLTSSQLSLATRATLFCEAKAQLSETCVLKLKLDWGLKLSGKAQMGVFDYNVVNYNGTIFEEQYPIYEETKIPIKADTVAVTEIKKTSAKCKSKIVYLNNCHPTIISRGFCWDSLEVPTVMHSKLQVGIGIGNFSETITNLKVGTKYSIRSYAITVDDTIYGAEQFFKTHLYEIGDTAFGGIIFYLDTTGKHGMVCALQDQSSALGVPWDLTIDQRPAVDYLPPNIPTDTSFGSGKNNTDLIISIVGSSGSYGAILCKQYNGGGYNDWFLPSYREMSVMFHSIRNSGNINGWDIKFSKWYWSSTQDWNMLNNYEQAYVWVLSLNGSGSSNPHKYNYCLVRAARKF